MQTLILFATVVLAIGAGLASSAACLNLLLRLTPRPSRNRPDR